MEIFGTKEDVIDALVLANIDFGMALRRRLLLEAGAFLYEIGHDRLQTLMALVLQIVLSVSFHHA